MSKTRNFIWNHLHSSFCASLASKAFHCWKWQKLSNTNIGLSLSRFLLRFKFFKDPDTRSQPHCEEWVLFGYLYVFEAHFSVYGFVCLRVDSCFSLDCRLIRSPDQKMGVWVDISQHCALILRLIISKIKTIFRECLICCRVSHYPYSKSWNLISAASFIQKRCPMSHIQTN